MPKRLRAAIYTRISDDAEGEGLGVARQEQDCRQLCERKGWDVIDVYTDNDKSAYSGKRRPEYERLLDDVKGGAVDVIVCWHPDRLHRPQPKELEEFIDLLEATEVTVATVTAGERDFSTSEGRFMARIEGSIARRESEHKSERIRRKHQQLAEEGKAMGGSRRPYGYAWQMSAEGKRRGLRVIPEERLRVLEAARRVLAGESPYSITQDWNARGVPTVTGAKWDRAVLQRILTSGMVAGSRVYRGEMTRPKDDRDKWDAILDEPTWRRLRAILLDPSRKQTRAPRRYLLGGGLLRCAECGGKLIAAPWIARKGAEPVRNYACRAYHGGCGKVLIRAEPVEEIVSKDVMRALCDPDFLDRLAGGGSGPDEQALQADLAAAEADLEQLSRDHYAHKLITRAEFFAARTDLVAKIDQAKQLVASVTRRRPVAVLSGLDDIEKQWDGLGLERQRALISLAIEFVPISSAHRRRRGSFDSSRVGEPIWRV